MSTGPIVCATRGGEASRRTQERAVQMARERGAPLVLLFVADTSFANLTNKALSEALDDELARLGRTLLSIAQSRARAQGIAADAVVRHGQVGQAVESYIREANASLLILGAPQGHAGDQSFGSAKLHQFAERMHEATGVEVLVVE